MEDVEDDDVEVEICDEVLAWPSMFFISAIEFCISPRSCLTAAADDAVADDEADFDDEEEEDVREEDINRCVEEVLAILDVVVVVLLVEEDTLELLLLVDAEFSNSCDELMFALASIVPVVVKPAAAAVPADDGALVLNKLWPMRCAVPTGTVGVPLDAMLLPVSAKSDISRRGNKNCDLSVAIDCLG